MITVSKVNRLEAFVNVANPARCLLRVVNGLCVRVSLLESSTFSFNCRQMADVHVC